ncbi:MAG TPA: dicarboxylate/amino acid:cation symporter [Steroidobacteraceae bacterium]|nr:dicarboxylate/amino acid:cation symporter [Steroidobacteraceae bacterium]
MGSAGAETKPTPVLPILIAMVLGGAVGYAAWPDGMIGGVHLLPLFDTLGTMFINLLKMLIVPLILASVITGVASLGSGPDLGKLGGKTLGFYVITTLIAVLIALALVNLVVPGVIDGEPQRHALALTRDAGEVAAGVKSRAETSVLDSIKGIVPSNMVDAALNTKMIGLVLFSILFGFFLARIEQPYRENVYGFWRGVFLIMMRMTGFVMFLAPIGVFALIAKVVAMSGFAAGHSLALFVICVLGGLLLYGFVALPILLATVARVNPWRIYPAMAPALLTAFSTASSSATLPLSLDCLEQRAKVSPRIAGFVMPLGASMNHAGSALYECAAAMFIAQAYGLHLTFAAQFTVVILALITSMGMAGIPAASLVGIAVILAAVGLPAEAIGVLLVFDRILDMCRTSINVLADAACTVIVARLEGETGILPAPSKTEMGSGTVS